MLRYNNKDQAVKYSYQKKFELVPVEMFAEILTILLAAKLLKTDHLDNEPLLTESFKVNDMADDENIDDRFTSEERVKLKAFLKYVKSDNELETSIMRDAATYCRSFKSCEDCVRTSWYSCGWCHNFGCTHNPEVLCPLAGNRLEKPNYTDVKVCPSISHDGPILIAAGGIINIRVSLQAVDPVIYDKDIICQIRLDNDQKVFHVKGLILNSIVYCYPFSLDTQEADRGIFRLIWGGAAPFSNEMAMVVYQCDALASDCDSCRVLPAKYLCGWCPVLEKCVIGQKCNNNFLKWTLSKITCQLQDNKQLFYL